MLFCILLVNSDIILKLKQAAQSGIKKRSEKTLVDLEAKRRFFERLRADILQERKEFAKMKSQRLKDEEKEPWPPQWKPIKESIQYDCGIITSFVDDPWGVENMNEDDFKCSSLYKACGGDDDPQLLIKFKELIRQVRKSRVINFIFLILSFHKVFDYVHSL